MHEGGYRVEVLQHGVQAEGRSAAALEAAWRRRRPRRRLGHSLLMNHSTGKPTRAQAWRLEQLAGMRCIACVIEGRSQPHRTEVHHIVDKGYRSHSGGHDATLPLCSWHHRGIPPNGMKTD